MDETTAREWANDLRQLADLVEEFPYLNWDLRTMQNLMVDDLYQMTEAISDIGGKWDKHEYGSIFTMRREMANARIYIDVDLPREKVCKRIETGEIETYSEVDREAYNALPRIEKTRPKVVWECPPSLLALVNQPDEV